MNSPVNFLPLIVSMYLWWSTDSIRENYSMGNRRSKKFSRWRKRNTGDSLNCDFMSRVQTVNNFAASGRGNGHKIGELTTAREPLNCL